MKNHLLQVPLLGLAGVIAFVATPVQATEYLKIEDAQKLCFDKDVRFEAAHIIFSKAQKDEIEKLSGIPVSARAQKIWRVYNYQNSPIGWFVVDYVIGKHLLIDYAVAINLEKKVTNVEILAYRESYGGEIRSRSWLDQFRGKSALSPLELHEDITAIGGATLSTRHVTEGIKRILATLDVITK